jgi:hypothetical protein
VKYESRRRRPERDRLAQLLARPDAVLPPVLKALRYSITLRTMPRE